jgi:ATP-binding cassette subfamily C (CFTR/MRP) protein 4
LHARFPRASSFAASEGTQRRFLGKLNTSAGTWFWWLIGNRFLGFRLDLLSTSVVAVTSVVGILARDDIDPGLLGLGLVYAVALSGLFQFMVRMSALVETYMTSVERILHYADHLVLEEDPAQSSAFDTRVIPAAPWPSRGTIEVCAWHCCVPSLPPPRPPPRPLGPDLSGFT